MKTKKIISCFLAVLLLIGCVPVDLSFIAEAADVTMQQVYAIIYEGNKKFYDYTSSDVFDVDYFTIPEDAEEYRAGYEAKAVELTQNLTDDMEKAEAIHRWVSENVYYDYDFYNNPGSYSTYMGASQVFEHKRTICEGYASLLTQMLRCVGIPARKVLGYGNNTSLTAQQLLNVYNNGNTNHAWTEFYCDGKWYFADATWDSGNKYENQTFIDGKYRGSFFALSVEEYSLTHIPVYYYSDFLCDDFIIHITKSESTIEEYIGDGGVVEIPAEAKITKVNCFRGNTDITEVIIPDGVTAVGSFENCTSLKKVTLPESVTSLGSFDGCTALESIVIPDKVTSSPNFTGCSSLKTIHLGKGITRFDSYAFRDCLELETVTGGENLSYLSGHAFYNCPLLKDAACFQNLSYVDSRAFYKCPSMTTVILTNRTEALYDYSFYGMTNLRTVVIPSGNKNIKSIGYAAFYRCTSLETLAIPATVTSIGEHAFNGTSNLKTILFEGTQEQWNAITVENYNYGLANATVVCLGDHIHSYTETETVKATCVNEGQVTYNCQCTEDYAHTYSKLTPVTDHSLVSVTTEATCTVDGKVEYSCENCDYTETEVITAPGHDYEEEFTVDKQASCKQEGSKSRHCKNCTAVTDVTAIEKADHSLVSVTTEATCTVDGKVEYSCENCDYTETEVITAPGHDYEEEFTVDKQASCTQEGSKSRHCKNCTAVTDVTAIEKAEHSLVSVTTEATCIVDGKIEYSCENCDYTETEVITAPGHDYEEEFTVDKQASCKQEGSKSRHCKNCTAVTDVTAIEKEEHKYTEKVSEIKATCSTEGSTVLRCVCSAEKTVKTEKDKLNHEGETELRNQSSATCAKKGYSGDTYCKACGELVSKGKEIAPTGNHSYSVKVEKEATCNEEGIRRYTCVNCSNSYSERISKVNHIDSNADNKCDFCQDDLTEACDHLCHKGGFMGFIWKIVSFFLKIFKINPVCECGAKHY